MTKYAAICIENRFDVAEIVAQHKKYLPDYFDMVHIKDESIKTEQDYNHLLTSKVFWESLPYDKVLIFQHDSKLLRKGIEEFYDYDYVGAPWTFQKHGGNGGLSFRDVIAMKKCLELSVWNNRLSNEDVFFSNIMFRNPTLFNLAPREVCSKFSCEVIFQIGTLGVHAIERYLTHEQCDQILNQYKI